MKAFWFCSLLLAILQCKNLIENIKLNRRVIGGEEVNPPFKYPWLATLMRYQYYKCGGALIGDKFVLTAAHCMMGSNSPLKNFEVQLHRQDLEKDPAEESALVFSITQRIIHPGYNETSVDNDLAILVLNITDSIDVPEIPLDNLLYHKPGTMTTVMGWGPITPTTGPYPILQEVNLPIVKNEICNENYENSEFSYTVDTKMRICAGYEKGGKDACRGDSGSLLIYYDNHEQPTLIGIVSNGSDDCGASILTGLYMRIAHFRDWILSIIDPTPASTIKL